VRRDHCCETIMRVIDPITGKSYFRKRRVRCDEPGQARELTFSCYRRYQFLGRDRTCEWFVEALEEARRDWPFDLWAYVLMPEHVHLLIYPREPKLQVGRIVGQIKEKIARRAIHYLVEHAPAWLARITVQEGERTRRRFWQPGGGFDRNAVELCIVHKMIDYIHANPVRRQLVERPEEWRWSSAQWYAGIRPVPIEMDQSLPMLHPTG
jgi:putative transposase